MQTNNKFVLIDNKTKQLIVYHGKAVKAIYNQTDVPISKEDVEWVRTQEYPNQA